MKRIFASSFWTRVILALAVIFIVWSLTLIVSVKRQETDLTHEMGLINKLNGVVQTIDDLEKNLATTGADSGARWRSLYSDYRTRRAEFDPGDPKFRDLQVNLIRADSLLIRIDRLHADFRQPTNDPLWQKNIEADFYREVNVAINEVQNAIQTIRQRTEQISANIAEQWEALFFLTLVACFFALAVALLLTLLQKEMASTKEADEALRKNEEQIRQTFEQAPIGMAMSTPDGRFLRANQAFCDLLGYTENELLRRNRIAITHPDDLAAHRDLTNGLLRGEIPHFQLEKRYLTKKNGVIYTLLQASLVRDTAGKPLHFIEQAVDMTERKKAELAHWQSEERFRELVENIAKVFWLTDPAKNEMLYISPAYEKIWGRTCQSLYESPRNWLDAIYPEDRERVLKAALTKQVIGHYDETYRIQRSDGETRWIRDRAFPIHDEQGSVYRIAGIAEDITERKNFEAALQESEQRWNFVLEGSGDGVWDWDAQTNKVFYSKRWKEMLGYQEHEVSDSLDEFYSRIHPDDVKPTIAALEKHFRGEMPIYISERRVRCKNGSYKRILDRGKVMTRTANGKPLRVVGTYTDITELSQAKESAQKSQEQFRRIFEMAPIGMTITGMDGKFLQSNRAFCDMLGYTSEELQSKSWIDITHANDVSTNIAFCNKLLHGEIPYFQMQKRCIAKDGHAAHTLLLMTLIKDEQGQPLHFVGQTLNLTALEPTQEELSKKGVILQSIVDSMVDGVVVADMNGKFLVFNPAAEQIVGMGALDSNPGDWAEKYGLYLPDTATLLPMEQNPMIRAMQGEPASTVEMFVRNGQRPHGLWLSVTGTPLKDEAGQPLGGMIVFREVTTQKQAAEAIRKSEEQFRLVFELAPTGMALAGLDGTLLRANRAYCEMLGYTEEELKQLKFLEITHQDDIEINRQLMQKLLSGEIPHYQIEKRCIAKDGRNVHVIWESLLMRDANGNPSHLLGQAVDIAERKRAETELRQLNDVLEQRVSERTKEVQESEERLRRQSEALRALVSSKAFQSGELQDVLQEITATVARCLEVGRVSVWFYDEARSKIVCQDLYELKSEQHSRRMELLRQDLLPYFEALAEGRCLDAHDAQTDYRTRCFAEAYLKPLGITSMLDAPIRLGGEVIGVVCHEHVGPARQWTLDEQVFAGSIADLAALAIESRERQKSDTRCRSEREQMEGQIRRHAEELEQLVEERAKRIRVLEQQRSESEKLAATGRVAARIAHEINNPLAGIKNSFLLVKDGIPTTHRYYDYVRRIESEIERIARIVRQMFDLYRPQQDSMHSFPADIAIRDVVALLQTNCRERDISFDVDIGAPTLNVALAEGSLRQVLYNVIQNAIDASSPGGTVQVRAATQQQKLTISVIDQGQGIPAELQTRIFEPFFTTKSGLEHSGLGLGLSVSKGLVEAMGGTLDFESVAGKGTTFLITLPLDGLPNKTVPPPSANEAPKTTEQN